MPVCDAAYHRNLVSSIIAGRPWLCVSDVVIDAARSAALLLEMGADRVMVIGASRGTGELPDPQKIPCIDLGLTFPDMMGAIHRSAEAVANVSHDVVAQIDAFDPAKEARIIGPVFSPGKPTAGREHYGARQANWQALEDKMIVDALWDAIGVKRAPSEIVPARKEALEAAASRLDEGLGTVWVGDNREGWHGGATLLRWVRTGVDATAAATFLGARCDRARVMPFLDGIPCSIHGMVFPDVTIAFRPCEMLVFRVPGASSLAYAGAATLWDPSPEDRAVMRDVAVQVGDYLRAKEDYRGTFTVDGVITTEGFLPTELNPRFGAAISRMTASLPDLPLHFLNLTVTEGEDLEYRPRQLEKLVVEAADANRIIRSGYVLEGKYDVAAEQCQIVREGDAWREAREGEEPDGTITLGPATAGAFLGVQLNPASLSLGSSASPALITAMDFADKRWALGLDPFEAAPDLRR